MAGDNPGGVSRMAAHALLHHANVSMKIAVLRYANSYRQVRSPKIRTRDSPNSEVPFARAVLRSDSTTFASQGPLLAIAKAPTPGDDFVTTAAKKLWHWFQ